MYGSQVGTGLCMSASLFSEECGLARFYALSVKMHHSCDDRLQISSKDNPDSDGMVQMNHPASSVQLLVDMPCQKEKKEKEELLGVVLCVMHAKRQTDVLAVCVSFVNRLKHSIFNTRFLNVNKPLSILFILFCMLDVRYSTIV